VFEGFVSKDMRYALIRSVRNTESLTKSLQNTEYRMVFTCLGFHLYCL